MGTDTCLSCPPGFYCPSTSSNLRYQCLPGTYSIGGASNCTTCPSGSECPYTTQAVVSSCVSGYYATEGQFSCSSCPAGKACDIHGNIELCSLGFYSPEEVRLFISTVSFIHSINYRYTSFITGWFLYSMYSW